MPKVFFNEPDRAVARFRRWVHDEKNRHDINQAKLADALGISQPAVSMKLRANGSNQTEISLRDAIIIFRAMDATDEEILKLMKI